jgi:hypothetical protein
MQRKNKGVPLWIVVFWCVTPPKISGGTLIPLTRIMVSQPKQPQSDLQQGEVKAKLSPAQSVSPIVTRPRTGRAGFGSWQGRIFLLATSSRPALGPTQPPVQWVPEFFPRGVKRAGPEADLLAPSGVEVKNAWSFSSTFLPT